MIANQLVIHGSTPTVRLKVLHEISNSIPGGFIELDVETGEALSFQVDTKPTPLDNTILELGIRHLALDFEVNFSYYPENWEGYITLTDGEVVYCCNKLNNGDPIRLGSMYSLQAVGGFPHCLAPYLD